MARIPTITFRIPRWRLAIVRLILAPLVPLVRLGLVRLRRRDVDRIAGLVAAFAVSGPEILRDRLRRRRRFRTGT